jgi:Transposase
MITTMHSDQDASPPRVEVITSVQRRRRWPTAEKIRLVEETTQPGMSVSYVVRRAGVATAPQCLAQPATCPVKRGAHHPAASKPLRKCLRSMLSGFSG